MATSPAAAEATMIANLAEKTGKSLDAWIRIAAQAKVAKHGEIVKLLKSEHGLGHGYANLVAQKLSESNAGGPASGDDLIAAQYAGSKAELRPLFETLVAAIGKFGGDVEVSPKKSYVSLRRSKQFALIQPSTATRLDVGINLKGTPAKGRLEASGSFNAMVSHRVRVEQAADVNPELIAWLKAAYESA